MKGILYLLAIFTLGVLGGIFADQILCPFMMEKSIFEPYGLDTRTVYVTKEEKITIQENTALKNAIEKTEKAVVGIKTVTKTGKISEGSGMVLTSDGMVITLAELVPAGSECCLFIEGKETSFQILKISVADNLALLKVKNNNLLGLSFADAGKTKIGEAVFMLGMISEKGVSFLAANGGMVRFIGENYIETNILEKSSLKGSPLLNVSGEVLGINTIAQDGKVSAIPIAKVKSFVGL
ncbi:MAG: hypothetical protein COZ91_02225 [Candidatus Nealsonbacteria bacterium CG_4_8_14_3_um_filter_39_7]|uniref:Serine protease n=1 Tax=Candidatus Nealsonbacteria bacterium CG23_combo_of_CG06-09_8_20_14_all_39_17 TaxID=1974722 RepID=A0A2G9YTJ3_9BACT|nr:serine protease [Bacteroidota bacterium]PIP22574.1 MAG: hypothetical protein COX37_03270 [Candidatus Nealsonbacteria bacterium CG23_combo_of_CG06-09_8_20_14_all_39_17]PIU43832.1 MAG: hypothetical protein COS96_02340 [Candidatus Nealsonbacteria bacterium CG07_land_8_20_14_0_80_39_13]PIW91108.1 MAG: hypothetical protein COZ91_02225 [Candidatus Nealsonbacteria bacterium CG_4_8_14_3_um_filter_39_7]